MAAVARKLLSRELRQLRQRKFSSAALLKKNEDYVIRSSLPDIVIPETRLLDRLWRDYASFKDHVALESAESKKKYTYVQLQKDIAVFATSLLKKFKLKPGDIVGVMLPNCPEFVVVAFGTLQAGCVLTTINPIYKEYEVSHQVTTTEPKIMVTTRECYEIVVKGLKMAKSEARIVLIDDSGSSIPNGVIRFTELAGNGEADYALLDKIEKKQDDLAIIPFSSGTTGLPKGVDITYKNLLAAIEMMGNPANCFPKTTHGEYQEIVPCILPFFHIYGMVITLIGHLIKGCKLITMNKFSASLYFNILRDERVSLLYIVPPIAILLGKHPDVKPEFFRDVRHIVCGAAPLADTDAYALLEKSQKEMEFNQGYGATETTACTTSTFIGTKNLDYSACGVPMASIRLKFVDTQTGQPVPVGQPGELYIEGPTIMKGYHKNETATKESITEDGFFKTGDLGYYVPGKGMFITDRIKELIKVKGMQVAPAELESVLRSHPAVADAAVIGIPHEFHGEAPKAFVIRKNGQQITEEQLQDYVASKVASFKRIEEVMFVSDIPKTTSGKILRKDLKKLYA